MINHFNFFLDYILLMISITFYKKKKNIQKKANIFILRILVDFIYFFSLQSKPKIKYKWNQVVLKKEVFCYFIFVMLLSMKHNKQVKINKFHKKMYLTDSYIVNLIFVSHLPYKLKVLFLYKTIVLSYMVMLFLKH